MTKLTGTAAARYYKYGLAPDDIELLLLQQDYKCAICPKGIDASAHLDHDHRTGKARGMLCPACNTGLGMFRDSTRLLSSAIVYLEKHDTPRSVSPRHKKRKNKELHTTTNIKRTPVPTSTHRTPQEDCHVCAMPSGVRCIGGDLRPMARTHRGRK